MPAPCRTASGYREYGAEAVRRLAFIKAAQLVGLTLGEIREILALKDRGEAPCAYVAGLIQRHARELEERIRALERVRRDLERLARRAARLPSRPPDPASLCHIIETAALTRPGGPPAFRRAPRREGRS